MFKRYNRFKIIIQNTISVFSGKCLCSFLLLPILICSCESNSDLLTPKTNPKLVIYSFLSPSDTVVKVKVNESVNRFGERVDWNEKLKKVQIIFNDGERDYLMSSLDSDYFCTLKYQVQAGRTYSIKASCPDFPEVDATCTIPRLWTPQVIIETDPLQNTDYSRYINFKFEDQLNAQNYYLVTVYEEQYQREYENLSFLLYTEGSTDNYGGYCFKDQNFNQHFSASYSSDYIDSTEVRMYLLEIDADYYKYYTSLLNYSGSDDPFTEYSPIYSNINNGFGIFAGFNKYLSKITFK